MAIPYETNPEMVLCWPVGYSAGVAAVECSKCKTRYALNNAGMIMLNGKTYTDCPYCIADHLKELHDQNKELQNQALF